MDSINILLLIIIIYLLYTFTIDNYEHKEKFSYDKRVIPNNDKYDDDILKNTIINDVISWDNKSINSNVTLPKINPNLLNNQFHNDYRDVLSAFNTLIPDSQQRFNLANIPLTYSEPEIKEVKPLINDFINVLNDTIISQIPNAKNPNTGWDEMVPDPNIESGWDKMQKSLGLTPSLYEKPAMKNIVKLILIKYVQKYETDDEIKYAIEFVIQKINVEDQMYLRGTFVQDKRPLRDENNFFVDSNVQMKIIIEDLFVLGFLSKDGDNVEKLFEGEKEKFYDYNKLEYNNMTDPKYVIKMLEDNYKKRNIEMNNLVATLDEEGQDFHKKLPTVYDYSNIKGTRTIYDDINTKKIFI
jgi:hypothetical protein